MIEFRKVFTRESYYWNLVSLLGKGLQPQDVLALINTICSDICGRYGTHLFTFLVCWINLDDQSLARLEVVQFKARPLCLRHVPQEAGLLPIPQLCNWNETPGHYQDWTSHIDSKRVPVNISGWTTIMFFFFSKCTSTYPSACTCNFTNFPLKVRVGSEKKLNIHEAYYLSPSFNINLESHKSVIFVDPY